MLKNVLLYESILVLFLFLQLIDAQDNYKKFKKAFKKPRRDRREEMRRQSIFSKTVEKVKQHNNRPSNFTLAVNELSDWDDSELSKLLGVNVPDSLRTGTDDYLSLFSLTQTSFAELQDERQKLPTTYDLRKHKCMPAVKNQGLCGSCWAFIAITPLEFSYCIKYNKSTVLSEQHLIDCMSATVGCNGGWYTTAWDFITKGGIASQSAYPYKATKSTCKYKPSMLRAKLSSWKYIASNNSVAMQSALVKYGPLAVAMNVVDSFYSYARGIYNDKACDNSGVNHGAVIVGYGVLNKVNYWLARNSWGSSWGLKGYFMIQRGVNKCNIELYPAYVIPA